MTMSKFNNDTYQRQKSNLKIKKNKTKIETAKGDIISISNSSDNDKKIMISELDIEISNDSKNSYPIQPMNYPHNNRNHKYNKNSGNQYYNQNKNKDFKEESKKNNESSALTKTLLNKDSRPFIPPSIKNKIKEEKKEELKLNLDAESYLPNNTQLRKQEKEVHPDKEEKNLNKEKDKEKNIIKENYKIIKNPEKNLNIEIDNNENLLLKDKNQKNLQKKL